MHHFQGITTVSVYMTSCHLKKSFIFDTKVKIVDDAWFSICAYNYIKALLTTVSFFGQIVGMPLLCFSISASDCQNVINVMFVNMPYIFRGMGLRNISNSWIDSTWLYCIIQYAIYDFLLVCHSRPDQEVDQRGHGKTWCKKIAKHVIWTRRMLWIVVDRRSW